MLELDDLLAKAGIDPASTIVMRHRPQEPALRRVFSWLAVERPDLFAAYQSCHYPRAEKALTRARHLVALIGQQPGSALFICVYRLGGHRQVDRTAFWNMPVNHDLASFGMTGWDARDDSLETALWFDLHRLEQFDEYSGRIQFTWPGLERSWYRWADRNTFAIQSLHEYSVAEADMPPWRELDLSWKELAALPRGWAIRLGEWRGVYLITDISDGKQYVGSAYGDENILGRWRRYAETGHGDNRNLLKRSPENFRFSILQRVSPDLDPADVIAVENSWKIRLLTRELGLNAN